MGISNKTIKLYLMKREGEKEWNGHSARLINYVVNEYNFYDFNQIAVWGCVTISWKKDSRSTLFPKILPYFLQSMLVSMQVHTCMEP